ADDRSGPRRLGSQFPPGVAERSEIGAHGLRRGNPAATVDLDEDRASLPRRQAKVENSLIDAQRLGRGIEAERRRSSPVVETGIAQHDLPVPDFGLMDLAASFPDHATHFEQVGEIGGELDFETQAASLKIEIADAEPFEATRIPQEARAADVYEVVIDDNRIILDQIGVSEVTSQR